MNASDLGWDESTSVELDHRLLKAPHVKLRSITEGPGGDVVYCVDLRIYQPNVKFMSLPVLHSMEHFLLYGFQRYMPNNFISVSPMGCQTGFYLVLFNEGRAEKIFSEYENILNDILKAKEVPYATISQCGNYLNHSLMLAKVLAWEVLQAKSRWRQVV